MPAPRIPRTVLRPKKEPRPGDSAEHLDNVRKLPCCITGQVGDVQAHHLLRIGEQLPKGTSRKNLDKWTIPLSRELHMALHHRGDEEGFLAERGIDGRALAEALWRNRGDEEAMQRVVFRFWQRAQQ